MQVFGLFTVVATATGCLYFLNQDDVADSSGLTAAGIMLLILNITFVAVLAFLIMKRGSPTVLKWARKSQKKGTMLVRQIPGVSRWLSPPYKRSGTSSSLATSASRTSSVQLGLLPLVQPQTGPHTLGTVSSGATSGAKPCT